MFRITFSSDHVAVPDQITGVRSISDEALIQTMTSALVASPNDGDISADIEQLDDGQWKERTLWVIKEAGVIRTEESEEAL